MQEMDAEVFLFHVAQFFMEVVGLFKAIRKLVKIWVFKSVFKAEIWEIKKKNLIGNRKRKEIALLVKGEV